MILEPQDFRDLFFNSMKRGLSRELPVPPPGIVLNLGSGNSPIKGAMNLDRPDPARYQKVLHHDSQPGEYAWSTAPLLRGYGDETIAAIHAYHFLEHLNGDDVSVMLQEAARILKVGGVFYYCVPYAMAPIAYMDVDHKTFWTEETMRTLLKSRGYDSAATNRFKIEFQVIAGVTSQNLAVLGALQKQGDE